MTRIIVDIGSTHGGSEKECFKAIDNAAAAGIKDVKFQLLEPEHLKNGNIEIKRDWLRHLVRHGKTLGVNVFASVWTNNAYKCCIDACCKTIKLAASAKAFDIFEAVSNSALDIHEVEIISSTKFAEKRIVIENKPWSANKHDVKHLVCITEYPVFYKVDFSILKGYDGFSDHTLGINQSKIAIISGAKIIEKHVSQTKCDCPDNKFAVSWSEIKELVQWSRTPFYIQVG